MNKHNRFLLFFFFSSRRRHTRCSRDWSSDVCSSDLLFINPLRYSRQDIKSCFDDAGGLRAGAAVRIAGVDVGTVRSVRAKPQNKNCPAEVEMVLATAYEIRIPKDSLAEINTAGLLGEADVNIDTTQASGAAI